MWKNKFESIGEDLMVELFAKVAQDLKSLIRLRCVSKSWRQLVNSQCIPKLTCNVPLAFKGHLMKVEIEDLIESGPPVLAYTTHRCQGDDNHFGQEAKGGPPLLESNEESGLVFLDACNGLLLHRQTSRSSSSSNSNYNHVSSPLPPPSPPPVYRVSNLETNSWVVVNGESDTADSMDNKMDHAVLAYDPAESLVSFKIIAFFRRLTLLPYNHLSPKCMRIYSSKTGKWSPDLNFDHHLLHYRLIVRWVHQSFYLNGVIYRLPTAHHLLRFEIPDEENYDDEYCGVQPIQLPEGNMSFFNINFIQVGINKGRINLVIMGSFYRSLKVWILEEEGYGNNYSYQWILKHHIPELDIFQRLVLKNIWVKSIKPLGFHPYEDVIVIFAVDDFQFRFICYHLDRNFIINVSSNYQAICDTLPQGGGLGRLYSLPFFSCAVPLQ